MSGNLILFAPSVRTNFGFGHLKRCLKWAHHLKADLFWPQGNGFFTQQDSLVSNYPDANIIANLPENEIYDLVILDQRETSVKTQKMLSKQGKLLIGLDEGGELRTALPFLVDTLDNLNPRRPNKKSISFLDLGASLPVQSVETSSLLVSFGGEDPHDLTRLFYDFWVNHGWNHMDVTVVLGPYFKQKGPYPGWKTLDSPPSLQEILPHYGSLVTSYGITAWEGVTAGLLTLLINPSPYHQKLGLKAGFPSLLKNDLKEKLFYPAWASREESLLRLRTHLNTEQGNFPTFLESFHHSPDFCPLCHSKNRKIIARDEHKTYSRCSECTMVYLTTFNLPEKKYTKTYFHEEYQKQYGRTYLEDFDHIKSMGKERVRCINSLLQTPGGNLLDAGCAYGPFLAAAKDGGMRPFGLDVASDAIIFIKEKLGFPGVEKSLLDLDWPGDFPGAGELDVLTLWYVIEHFPDLDPLLRVINKNLKLGGLLAFSTPHGQGISGLFSPEKFYHESPEDHFSIWSPKIAKKVLKRFGFQVKKIRITGHHPERFPGLKKSRGFLYEIISALSSCLGWGDTFEVYARKVKNL